MKPIGIDYFVYPEKGGLIRDPALIASHLQPGASDEALLQETVSMTIALEPVGRFIRATVTITNTGAGHDVPTDFPGRHMILVVSGSDRKGRALAQSGGPQVPEWGGPEAGLPGTAYAKVLRDVQTGEAPVVTYWRQALIVSDNRIPALASDTTVYTFTVPSGRLPATVEAELRFRRVFWSVMDGKGWDTPDIVMATARRTVMRSSRP
jgi:hypothetical protein